MAYEEVTMDRKGPKKTIHRIRWNRSGRPEKIIEPATYEEYLKMHDRGVRTLESFIQNGRGAEITFEEEEM